MFQSAFGSEVTTVAVTAFFVFGAFSITPLSHEQVASRLRAEASRDGLTGVLNRAGFLQQAQRSRKNDAALILTDLDGYKAFNDTYGRQTGDQALQAFATACLESVRETDLVGRYGGDEFIILLSGASLEQAERAASEISRRLRDAKPPELDLWPTVSCGVTPLHPNTLNLEAAIAAADAALYEAKALGRDRVVRARPTGRVSNAPPCSPCSPCSPPGGAAQTADQGLGRQRLATRRAPTNTGRCVSRPQVSSASASADSATVSGSPSTAVKSTPYSSSSSCPSIG